MNNRNNGFTLIELIIVIAVIVILAAIAIPSFSTVVFQSEATVCSTNRQSAETTLQNKIMLDQIEQSELESELHKMGITCSANGSFHAKYNEETQKVSVECTKHTGTTTQYMLDKFTDMCKNYKDYSEYESNSLIRNAMYEQQGDTWNSIGFRGDDTNYYIQPYWNIESNEIYLFAGTTNTATGSWHTGYIYNANTATWYHGKAFSFVNESISNWNDVWNKMQADGWKPVEVEYEKLK